MGWVKQKMDWLDKNYKPDFAKELKAINRIVKKLDKYQPEDKGLQDEQTEAAKEASELLIQASHIIAAL